MALLGALELDYRAHGQRPHVPDSAGLLALVASRAMNAPGDAVIIAGSSRALADLDAGALSAALGGRPVFQLAQDGVSCLPVLEQIANETAFAGTVLCGAEPTSMFGAHERDRERTGVPRIRLPHVTWAGWIDARIGIAVRSRLAILSRDVRGAIGRAILGRAAWPRPAAAGDPMLRASTRHFAGVDTAAADARWADLFESAGGRATTAAELDSTTAYVAGLAARITARGGHVLFLELPSSGRTRALEERRYPRERYWDRFVAGAGAPAVTVRDLATVDAFRCADGSHLDADDAPAFTRATGGRAQSAAVARAR